MPGTSGHLDSHQLFATGRLFFRIVAIFQQRTHCLGVGLIIGENGRSHVLNSAFGSSSPTVFFVHLLTGRQDLAFQSIYLLAGWLFVFVQFVLNNDAVDFMDRRRLFALALNGAIFVTDDLTLCYEMIG